jgi:hypothetical protein
VKTIVENATNLSKYLLADDVAVVLSSDNIVVGDPAMFVVSDLNAGTATVYEGVTAPEDWAGNKYTFDGADWTLNPNWVEPLPPTEETPS